MDETEAMPETENVDYAFSHFIYGFLTLLGICILFSLGKLIYHYYKIRAQSTGSETTDSPFTEIHTISNENLVSDRQIENNEPEPDRLLIQLHKLRKLLNRLNAMGTFSRDTIGDLSAQSAACANNSRAASSDMSAFWSSIDFDDFEESTINEGKLQKTLTEKSVSPSLSDVSLDTSGIPFDNTKHRNFAASSRENILYSSKTSHHTHPSDAIVQILTILDSIMLKNRNDAQQLEENTSKIDRNSDEAKNFSSLTTLSNESLESQRPTTYLPLTLDKNISAICKSPLSDIEKNTSRYMKSETVNSGTKLVGNALMLKSNLLKQSSHVHQSHYEFPCAISQESKFSKGKSFVNIASSTQSKNLYATKFSASSQSLNNKFSASQSISVCLDQSKSLSCQARGNSKSSSAVSTNCHLIKSDGKMLSKTEVAEISQLKVDLGDMNRSHSLSNLIDKKSRSLSFAENIAKSYSSEKEQKIGYKSQTIIKVTEYFQNSKKYPPKDSEILHSEKNTNEIKTIQSSNNQQSSSISSKSLPTTSGSDVVTIEFSNSESQIRQLKFLEVLSPCVSSASSETFLSPVVTSDLSPFQKIDWKSPEEPIPDNCISKNLTPHNENAFLTRKSCIWSTPPSPKDNVSQEANVIIT